MVVAALALVLSMGLVVAAVVWVPPLWLSVLLLVVAAVAAFAELPAPLAWFVVVWAIPIAVVGWGLPARAQQQARALESRAPPIGRRHDPPVLPERRRPRRDRAPIRPEAPDPPNWTTAPVRSSIRRRPARPATRPVERCPPTVVTPVLPRKRPVSANPARPPAPPRSPARSAPPRMRALATRPPS